MKKRISLKYLWAEDEAYANWDEDWNERLDNDAIKSEEASFLEGYYENGR